MPAAWQANAIVGALTEIVLQAIEQDRVEQLPECADGAAQVVQRSRPTAARPKAGLCPRITGGQPRAGPPPPPPAHPFRTPRRLGPGHLTVPAPWSLAGTGLRPVRVLHSAVFSRPSGALPNMRPRAARRHVARGPAQPHVAEDPPGCIISTVKRPSAVVTEVRPSGLPFWVGRIGLGRTTRRIDEAHRAVDPGGIATLREVREAFAMGDGDRQAAAGHAP